VERRQRRVLCRGGGRAVDLGDQIVICHRREGIRQVLSRDSRGGRDGVHRTQRVETQRLIATRRDRRQRQRLGCAITRPSERNLTRGGAADRVRVVHRRRARDIHRRQIGRVVRRQRLERVLWRRRQRLCQRTGLDATGRVDGEDDAQRVPVERLRSTRGDVRKRQRLIG